MHQINQILLLSILVFGLFACKKDNTIVSEDLKFEVPTNFPTPKYDFTNNEITKEGFELGRRLFYDPILSRDSSISCGDCHISFSAFSHPDHGVSHGIDGKLGTRNAPAIQNMAWRTTFFWDGGVPNLDLVPLNAIQNPVEMDETPANIIQKLNNHTTYPALFKVAFANQDTITGAAMLKAMSQFMNMLVSANSKYDKYIRNETGGKLNAEEQQGLDLFKQKCASCHSGELMSDNSFRNNGIVSDFSLDAGRYLISTLPDDKGKFIVPSLRNIEKTAPYMHTGKIKTLNAVLDHYANGVKDSPTLDPLLKQNNTLGIPLTETEKTQIIAFLKTLTDEEFIRDVRFQK
jgi:cytochrome c peroxidase